MTFFWVQDDIAGASRPHGQRDMRLLQHHGISALLTLTVAPLPQEWAARFSLCHIPIDDFSPPTEEQFWECCAFMRDVRAKGGKICVHCTMGIGRTGTILAGWLITQGYSADDALEEIRRCRPGAVETSEQEAFLRHIENLTSSAS